MEVAKKTAVLQIDTSNSVHCFFCTLMLAAIIVTEKSVHFDVEYEIKVDLGRSYMLFNNMQAKLLPANVVGFDMFVVDAGFDRRTSTEVIYRTITEALPSA